MTEEIWLVRYSEIFLKSEPVRRIWEDLLVKSLQNKLPDCMVTKTRGRVWISGSVDPEKISHTFGVQSFSPCSEVRLSDLKENLLLFAKDSGISSYNSFAIRIHRVGTHSFNSRELARDLGGLISESWPHLTVDLTDPELELFVEVRDDRCFLYNKVIIGPGGIPQGASGTLVALHSGGIDSPVAMYMMMKRGCIIHPLYIKISPFHDDSSEERARLIVKHLKRFQPEMSLRVIEDIHVFTTRTQLRKRDQEKYACVLCKRYMYRTAEQYAKEIGAKGIVTGESLAQVASQTLDNLYVLDDAVSTPVYRPLIGFDKEETIVVAEKIGTYALSIMQVPGCCCSIPMKPATTSKRKMIDQLESDLQSLS